MGLLSSVHGYEGDPGMNTGGLLPDPVCAYHYAAAMLVALNHRQQTGEGQRIDLSMMEAFAVQFGDAVLEYEANKEIRKPRGNSHPTFAPHGIYAAKDSQWLAIAAETDAMWKSLATYMGAPELADDSRFNSIQSRQEHRKELDAIMEDWCKNRDPAEEEKNLGALGVCAARVVPFIEVYRKPNEQFRARDFFVPITHPESGTHLYPRVPWHLPGTEELPLRHSPRFGEHSAEVFKEEAGISDEEYQELLAAGITGTEQT
jgi:crotonobetainyl-CoA:carnitine CoA-transferase CaiB-like acyl-CoA transferase